MNDQIAPPASALDALVGLVADEFTERLNRGEHPDIEEYAQRHPQIAELLRQLLRALEVTARRAAPPTRLTWQEPPRAPWRAASATFVCCVRSAAAAWALSTRPSRFHLAGAWP